MSEFKDRLRKAIFEKQIKASELSRLTGIGKSDISNYLNGKYLAKQNKVYMLAKALDVDPGWLITGIEPEQNVVERQIPIVVPDNDRFVKLVNYMPEEDYQLVMKAFEKAEKRMKEEEGENE